MTLTGTIQNGVVVLDDGHRLPEGTRVEVVVSEKIPSERPFQGLLDLAGTVSELPPDMALNHDHYLYGAAKK